jgi:16S rRNA (uracil1498-N3)-methyltransferase
MDYTIQKSVELGVAAIAPVTMARSVARLDTERAAKREARWGAIVIAACEQCGRNRLPLLHAPVSFSEWIAAPGHGDLRVLLAPEADQTLGDLRSPAGSVELLVGPEGGLAPEESAAALRAGFRAVRLGPRILRTETAALAALSALNALWGDWR